MYEQQRIPVPPPRIGLGALAISMVVAFAGRWARVLAPCRQSAGGRAGHGIRDRGLRPGGGPERRGRRLAGSRAVGRGPGQDVGTERSGLRFSADGPNPCHAPADVGTERSGLRFSADGPNPCHAPADVWAQTFRTSVFRLSTGERSGGEPDGRRAGMLPIRHAPTRRMQSAVCEGFVPTCPRGASGTT